MRSLPSKQLSTLICGLVLIATTNSFALELNRTLLDFIDARFGSEATERLEQWQQIANSDPQRPILEKLKLVNAFFNRAAFISDMEHWGREDYWATPVELLATNAGDCEDYSIAKYFTLKELGVPVEKLKITYVKALKLNQAHMVLAYYETPEATPLILDNLINEIKPASERRDLMPVYSFNGEGLWLSKFRGTSAKRISGPDKLENWLDMMDRQSKLLN